MLAWPHRLYEAALDWLERQWNEPTADQWYAAAIACEVRRVLSDNPNSIQPRDLLLKFHRPAPARRNAPRESLAEMKARWFGILGVRPRG